MLCIIAQENAEIRPNMRLNYHTPQIDEEDIREKRKVVIFSYFADTADWIEKDPPRHLSQIGGQQESLLTAWRILGGTDCFSAHSAALGCTLKEKRPSLEGLHK